MQIRCRCTLLGHQQAPENLPENRIGPEMIEGHLRDLGLVFRARPVRSRTIPGKRGQIMCSHSWNKLIAASSALAAAGVLACAAALLDAFMPKGSLAAFLASMALLGLLVTGVVIGFTWVCDKGESHSPARPSSPARVRETPAASARGVSYGRHSSLTWNATAARFLRS
jgi:hypothetical protein